MIKAIETTYKGRRFRSRTEARWAVFFDALGTPWEYEREGFELPSGRYLPDFWLPRVHVGCWFEVKGTEPTTHERQLAKELAEESGSPVFIFSGIPVAEVVNEGELSVEYYFRNEPWAKMFTGRELWNMAVKELGKDHRLLCGADFERLTRPCGLGFFPPHGRDVTRADTPYVREQFAICEICGAITICGSGTTYHAPCHPRSPSRWMLEEPRSAYQEELLAKSCDSWMMKAEQVQRLVAAFEKAVGARFEFGENQ